MLKTIKILFASLVLSALPLAVSVAVEVTEDNFDEQYKRYLDLYADEKGNEDAFLKQSQLLKDYYRKQNNPSSYYTICMNEALYDTEHDKPYTAIQKVNDMLEEMEAEEFDGYYMIHLALGTVFESRGNKRMAQQYYQQAIDETEGNEKARMSIYSRMAYLLMFTDPNKAEYWNEKIKTSSLSYPPYHQTYLFISSCIKFAVNNKSGFYANYEEYQNYHLDHKELDSYGMKTIEIMKMALDGQTKEALQELALGNTDINVIGRHDMRIIIYRMTGNHTAALDEWERRTESVDSLNSDMLFNNLNEINAATGIAQIQADASKRREMFFIILLSIAAVGIVLMGYWIVVHRRMSNNLKEKTEQLRSALAMAEEGDKMKTEFIRSVSHEIRTPLNAINGFNDLLNTPGLELPEEERADLLNRIKENVQAITDIVDEMLHIADKESNEYPKTDSIYCNQTLSAILYKYRSQVSSSIELNYTSDVINRFSIKTNKEAVTKILDQLIQNAIKFTQKGFINMHCEESHDHKLLRISVTDTGKGVAPDQQDKIFESFYKVDSFQQGIGLGLTVSAKIAHKLGGELTLDKNYTTGARFVLSLPIE